MPVELRVYAGCGCVEVRPRRRDHLIVDSPGIAPCCPGHDVPVEVTDRADDLFAAAYWVEHEPFQDWALAILAEWGMA